MGESVLAALITGVLALIGIIVTNMMSNRSIENKLITAQAVTNEKIDQLRKEVEKHNNFASRIPVIEEQIKELKNDFSEITRRLTELENKERDRSL